MPALRRLPDRADGAEGLLALTESFSARQVFEFILLCRTAQGRGQGQDPGGEALSALAAKMIDAEMDASNVGYEIARRTVADRLGYADTSRTNFYKLAEGGRAPDKRPNSKARARRAADHVAAD